MLDQVTSSTDAKGQVTALSYDLLGRTIQRAAADLTATWTFDTAVKGIGKLASSTASSGIARAMSYDGLGRPLQATTTIAGNAYTTSTAYDALGRVASVAYPSGVTVAPVYNALGYQTQLKNQTTNEVYWTADARNAAGQLTQETAGSGLVTARTFEATTGRLTATQTGPAGNRQSQAYTYDTLGRLLSRSDANTGLSESFGYDGLGRLTSANVAGGPSKSFAYDFTGNLTSKSDVGTYSYPAAGSARPHAVASIAGAINANFTYDANGNQTSGNGVAYTYTSYDKPSSITRGGVAITFDHDGEAQRFRQISPLGETLYLGGVERLSGAGTVQWTTYLFAGGGAIGAVTQIEGQAAQVRYFHKDHLGSITTVTDATGLLVERLSYDAWGKRRYPNGQDDPAGALTGTQPRGFTGHEQLDAVDLVHMNGRVYDPVLARFASADPMTESPFSTQGWNRYSYVGDSPVNFTDPSGYCFMGCAWQGAFRSIGAFLRRVPIAGTLLQVALPMLCGPGAPACAAAVAIATSMAVAGLQRGKLGVALRAGLITAATIGAFYVAGEAISGASAGSEAIVGPQGPPIDAGAAEVAADPCAGVVGGCFRPTQTTLPGIVVQDPAAVTPLPKSVPGWSTFATNAGEYLSRSWDGISRMPEGIWKFTLEFYGDPLGAMAQIAPNPTSALASGIAASLGAASRGINSLGQYGRLGGHHIHAKRAFEGVSSYDRNTALSVGQRTLESLGVRHADITAAQQALFRALDASGAPNTLIHQSRIGYQALTDAGVPADLAKQWVVESQTQLIRSGIFEPTRIPWGNR